MRSHAQVREHGGSYDEVYSRLMSANSGSFFGDCLAERRIDLCVTMLRLHRPFHS